MIRSISGYRDGGTVSITLIRPEGLKRKYEATEGLRMSEFKAAIQGCEDAGIFEICIDKRRGKTDGRWTIGYPDRPYAHEITDLSIKEWIFDKVEDFIEQQIYYANQIKELTKLYVQ